MHCRVGNGRHREQRDVRRDETAHLCGLGQITQRGLVVTHRGGQEADARRTTVDPGQVHREIGQRRELQTRTQPSTDSPAGGEDRRCVGRHASTVRRAHVAAQPISSPPAALSAVACHTADVEIINLPRSSLDGDGYGSRGIAMCSISGLDTDVGGRVHIAWCEPDGVLGCHRAGRHQLFAIISGTGWVAGSDGVRVSVSVGQAALWSPGEMHESGSTSGMTVLIIASDRPFR